MPETIYNLILNCVKGKVLEIGCGSGGLIDFLLDNGREAIGIDPFAYGAGCLRASAESLPFDEGSFDSVVSLRSLHHTDAPLSLREAYRILKPGGLICIADWRLGADTGVSERYFSEKEIEHMLEEAGFSTPHFLKSPEKDIFLVRATGPL